MNFLKMVKSVFVGKSPQDTSTANTVNVVDAAKVFRTSILVGLSAMVADLIQNVSPDMFGDHKLLATVILTGLSELSLRFLKNNSKKE